MSRFISRFQYLKYEWFCNNYLLQHVLVYRWLEDSLAAGKKVSEDIYILKVKPEVGKPDKDLIQGAANINSSSNSEQSHCKRIKSSAEEIKQSNEGWKGDIETNTASAASNTEYQSPSPITSSPEIPSTPDNDVSSLFQCQCTGKMSISPSFFVSIMQLVALKIGLTSRTSCCYCL